MSKEVSNKITHMNFILCIIIVFLHSNCLRFLDNPNPFVYNFYKFINVFADSAVPLFFILSGYLFYRTFDYKNIKNKFKSRFFGLVIPYLFWSIFFLIYYKIVSYIPSINEFFNSNFDLSTGAIIKNILFAECAEGMWFVRVLIIYVILSPIIYFIVKKSKNLSFFIITFFIIINMFFKISYSSFLFWMPIHLLAAYLGIFYSSILDNKKNIFNKKIWPVLMIYLIMIVICINVDDHNVLYYFYRLLSPLFLLLIFDLFNLYKYRKFKVEKIGFFMYCVHLPLLKIIRKCLFIAFGYNQYISILIYIFTIIFTILIIYACYNILNKIAPKFLKLISGNRA